MQKLKALIVKYREAISYLIFGGLTTLVSLGTYALFVGGLGLPVTGGNVLSWICAVAFAFVTNKLWVFRSERRGLAAWLLEAVKFVAGRLATGAVELFGLPLLMHLGLDQTILGIEGAAAKVVVTVVVIILNYFISKFIVFRKQKEDKPDA
ncbi:MAG: GtrA family protein [Oscillospiraceae bacterium]|nr:GtrA family protein [Oscillospiraceae bacterium]